MLTAWEENEDPEGRSPLAVVEEPFEPQPTHEEALRDSLMEKLVEFSQVSWTPMFDGFGIYSGRGLFCLVDQYGRSALRVSELSEVKYRSAGSERIGGLPFWTIPEDVLNDTKLFTEWAAEALGVSLDVRKLAFKF